jgi:hypothetical protein
VGEQSLDAFPILGIVVAFAILALVAYEIGFRLGRWWQERTPDETEEGPTGVTVGSLLALMAFLLAVTMGMASDRFDTRRGLVLAEANSIGTTFLRAGFLPVAEAEASRELLREYVPLRIITTDDRVQLAAQIERSSEIHDELWAILEEVASTMGSSDLLATYVESLNETIDLNTSRITAGLYARVPETVVLLLFGGTLLALGMVGYNAGLAGKRSVISAVVLVAALGAVLMLVVDLDRSKDGFLQVGQQPLIDLETKIGPPQDG